MSTAKRIVVAPLDWGLGHATRCIPIINALLDLGCDIRLAGSGQSLALLQRQYPSFTAYELPGYQPTYSRGSNMVGAMLRQLPHFVHTIRRERAVIKNVVQKEGIDVVISDNRYGCRSTEAHSVFITHQSNILMPRRFGWLASVVRETNIKLIRGFDECWIPDFNEGTGLAGDLAFGAGKFHPNVRYIGPLSRFERGTGSGSYGYDVVAVCSGPEPQRSVFEQLLLDSLRRTTLRFLLIRGIVRGDEKAVEASDQTVDFLTTASLMNVLQNSKLVIARSGYSTVMDLNVLGKKAIFVPTPGQTEQEYLAKRLKEKGIAFSMTQEEFCLENALLESEKYSGFSAQLDRKPLIDVVRELVAL